ncbi:peptidyl-prolyl cis-trans isomerase cyclophilin type [Micromonospora sp. ATCC 39149]|nr:peptidyl-prolyl cis-trans isomerase cyclophilin type [Micromonospora sp. ATCC 39149]
MLTKIGALPTVDNGSGAKVKPKTDVVIQSLTVGEPTTAPAPATSGPTASPDAG